MSLNMLVNWWRRPRTSNSRRRPMQARYNPRVELLEERALLDAGFSDLGPSGRFVTGLYYDLLGRQPQVAETSAWASAIGSTIDNAKVAQAIVNSDEFHIRFLRNTYQTLLGREADGSGLGAWVNNMRAGVSEQAVVVAFASSAEYFLKKGGTNSAFVTGLYQDLLGRAPDPFGLSLWMQQLQGAPRSAVANTIAHSAEGLTQQVIANYHMVLGRDVDPSGINSWVAFLGTGRAVEQLTVNLASSVEYFTGQLSLNLPELGVPQRSPKPPTWKGPYNTWPGVPPGFPQGDGSGGTGGGTSGGSNSNNLSQNFIFGTAQHNIKVSQGQSVNHSEIALAVNPTNPLNMVVADAIIVPVGPIPSTNLSSPIGTYYSIDGGKTWHYVPIDATVDGLVGPRAFRSDAELKFDATGRLFASYVALDDIASATANSILVVARSTNGGKNWSATNVIKEPQSVGFNDKEILATGRDPVNPDQQNVYVAWVRLLSAANVPSPIMISGSTDGGVTFSTPTPVSAIPHFSVQFANPSVGPDGEINVSFYDIDSGELLFATSPTFANGTFAFGPNFTAEFFNDNIFKTNIPAQPSRGIANLPKSITDTSNGPHRGRVYIVYTDLPDNGKEPNFDIFDIYSDDHGQTWSLPFRINDDTGINSQFNVGVAFDPLTGALSAEWRDARADIFNQKVDVFTSTSLDGVTWSKNIRVTDKPSDESQDKGADPAFGNNFLEYDGIAAVKGKVYFAWSDNRDNLNGLLSIWFDSINTGLKPVSPPIVVPQDPFDPNSTSETATQFGVLSGTQTYNNLTIANTPTGLPGYDWFQWSAAQDGTFTVTINYKNTTTSGDIHVRVFTLDSQNRLVQLGSSRGIGVTSQQVKAAVLANEPILVWVYGYAGAQGFYNMSVGLG